MKSPEINEILKQLLGVDINAGISNRTCVSCSMPAIQFKDEISAREFEISGLCQECQDKIFVSDEDEDEISL